MDWHSIIYPLLGGGLIGLAATTMLFFNGRVTGVSGILASAFTRPDQQGLWRLFFLAGMIGGGALMHAFLPELFINQSGRSTSLVLLAGFLVGYGTVMGSGCTSGHGICGLSRLSVRSVMATLTFMFFGFLSVQVLRYIFGGA